jgi:hypothetical protein
MLAVSKPRPLVFISASHKDTEWGERLKAALETDGRTEWWDDSRVTTGGNWGHEIQEALTRASAAVVLLSPDYLASKNAMPELATLAKRGADWGGGLLFPIVVHDCAWEDIEQLRDVQVWAKGRPLDSLPRTALQLELKAIVDRIAHTALHNATREPPVPPLRPPSLGSQGLRTPPRPAGEEVAPAAERSETPGFKFSVSAEHVIAFARQLAERSGRPRITSSCLLFAFSESADTEGGGYNTPRFVRQTMERTGKYVEALNAFLNDASKRPGPHSAIAEPVGAVSVNVGATLEAARAIAEQTARTPTIHSRHLFAALLATPAQGHHPAARARLQRLGVDVRALVREFRDFVRVAGNTDTDTAWDSILGSTGESAREVPHEPPSAVSTASPPSDDRYVSGPAGYTSEFVGVGGGHPVGDQLGVRGSAERLAELIALRETKMPLAIGLFGDWGSGKSHFMNLIDRRLKTITAAATDGPWCMQIVPIYFNAWHYLDASLWASLVTEIFDGLFRHLEGRTDVLATARAQLLDAGGAVARAEEEVTRARAAVTQANTAARDARMESTAAREAVSGLLNNLRVLVPRARLEQAQAQLEDWLGVNAEVATLSQLARKHRDVASLPGRIRELWRRTTSKPDRWWRIGWLAALLVVTPAMVWFGGDSIPGLKRLLESAGPLVKLALGWVIGALTWLTPGLIQIQRGLTAMQRLQTEAEEAAARARDNNPRVVEAERRAREAEAAAGAAEATLAQAKTNEQRLTQAVDDLLPERRLARFIEARARSADYRGQLGLVSLARRDFQQLSEIFTDREALDAKKLKLPEKAAALEELGRSIDRIVLFVDDLDRCQPDKVVDVLQAVHLLLAFPLFAVVVGVDQRCLRQSLRTQFSGLLYGDRPANATGAPAIAGEDEPRPATPLDYLEKIFHVPFHLQPMKGPGFADLMEVLIRPPEATSPASGTTAAATSVQSRHANTEADKAQMASAGSAATETPTSPTAAGYGASVAPQGSLGGDPAPSPPEANTIGSVPLQGWERTAIKHYHPLVRTPRGATRFLNTYRLVRAGLVEPEWAAFRGDGDIHGEFRIAMLLLAAAAGRPAVAREWFQQLRKQAPHEVRVAQADAQGWEHFKALYESTVGRFSPPPSLETMVKWIERVEQYTF